MDQYYIRVRGKKKISKLTRLMDVEQPELLLSYLVVPNAIIGWIDSWLKSVASVQKAFMVEGGARKTDQDSHLCP